MCSRSLQLLFYGIFPEIWLKKQFKSCPSSLCYYLCTGAGSFLTFLGTTYILGLTIFSTFLGQTCSTFLRVFLAGCGEGETARVLISGMVQMVNCDANLLSWKYAQNSSNSLRFISIFNKNYKHNLLEEIIASKVEGESLMDFPQLSVSKKYQSPGLIKQTKLVGLQLQRQQKYQSKQVYTMTQGRLKVMCLVSIGLLAICVLELQTLLALSAAFFFSYLYFRRVIEKYLEQGLIELLPHQIQYNLLYRSIFDLVCDFWFLEAFRFLKLITKPLLQPIYPDNAIEALDNVAPSEKNKYLIKGIFRVMPQSCQKILLGKDRLESLQAEVELEESCRINKERDSEKNTDDESEKEIPRLGKESFEISMYRQQDKNMPIEREIVIKETPHRWDRLDILKKRPNLLQAKENILGMVHNSVGTIKNIMELIAINGRIQKMSTATIIKLTILFWVILIAQLKFNKNSRQIVLKTLYILGGVISVFGTVGTTGALLYKQLKKEPKVPQIQQ